MSGESMLNTLRRLLRGPRTEEPPAAELASEVSETIERVRQERRSLREELRARPDLARVLVLARDREEEQR